MYWKYQTSRWQTEVTVGREKLKVVPSFCYLGDCLAFYLYRLQRNDQAMNRWMCGGTTKEQFSSQDLLEGMQIDDWTQVLRSRRLRWHDHVERSDGWLKKVRKLNPTGGSSRGCPKKIWTEMINNDCLLLIQNHPSDRKAWNGRLRGPARLDPPLC